MGSYYNGSYAEFLDSLKAAGVVIRNESEVRERLAESQRHHIGLCGDLPDRTGQRGLIQMSLKRNGVAAEDYAIVLDRAQQAIRRAHPGAVVVIGLGISDALQ